MNITFQPLLLLDKAIPNDYHASVSVSLHLDFLLDRGSSMYFVFSFNDADIMTWSKLLPVSPNHNKPNEILQTVGQLQ